MISGAYSVPRVTEESVCRSSQDYRFTEIGIYKIHSTALMSNIPFGEASGEARSIDSSIFENDEETQLHFKPIIRCQNFLSTRYIGRAPLEWYGTGMVTKKGHQAQALYQNAPVIPRSFRLLRRPPFSRDFLFFLPFC